MDFEGKYGEDEHKAAPVKDVPAIGVTFDQRLDDYRHVVFQSHVAADCSQAELNGVLDKVRKAAERQKAIAHLPTLRGMLADKEEAVKTETAKHFAAATSKDLLNNLISRKGNELGRRTPAALSAQDKSTFARAEQEMGGASSQIAILHKAIAVDRRNIEAMVQLISEGE